MLWGGRSIKSEVTRPCADIGNLSVVPCASAAIIKLTPRPQSRGLLPFSHLPRRSLSLCRFLKGKGPREKKEPEASARPLVSWPKALRAVRAWLEPWVLLQRFWQAWSPQHPPLLLQQLLDHLSRGSPLYLSASFDLSQQSCGKGAARRRPRQTREWAQTPSPRRYQWVP